MAASVTRLATDLMRPSPLPTDRERQRTLTWPVPSALATAIVAIEALHEGDPARRRLPPARSMPRASVETIDEAPAPVDDACRIADAEFRAARRRK